jgi:hypothetical protein
MGWLFAMLQFLSARGNGYNRSVVVGVWSDNRIFTLFKTSDKI